MWKKYRGRGKVVNMKIKEEKRELSETVGSKSRTQRVHP